VLSLLQGRDAQPEENDYLVYNYNRFQACRFGLDGMIVNPKTYESRFLRSEQRDRGGAEGMVEAAIRRFRN
jgi:carboxylate-amine ligase